MDEMEDDIREGGRLVKCQLVK